VQLNKEYFANRECHNCGKKGYPERCCTNKKGKVKKDSEDNKSLSSSKLIKSLTKQVKTLKKLVTMLKAHKEDINNDCSLSSEDGDAHFQYACAAVEATNQKLAMVHKSHKSQDLDLRSVWLLDNQCTFDLCYNLDFSGKRRNGKRAVSMSSNGGGLQISKEFMVLGYDFWVWFSIRATTNIICLKNLIRLYRVTYDSERQTAYIVHLEDFGCPFDLHPCGLHVYYPKKTNGQYGFV
jgi:hypothetical protein